MLKNQILAEVKQAGAIGVDRFMDLCNSYYYSSKDPLGSSGDFITAPEISQIFGEMLGIWAITAWEKIGKPAEVALVELGPGRGTLMADLLRGIKVAPAFKPQVHFVEISPVLKQLQQQKVQHATWHNSYPTLPIPTIVIANEFFDALPIKQFCGTEERVIKQENDEMIFSTSTVTHEESAACTAVMTQIAAHASAACIIDYGYTGKSTGDTLQSIKSHQFTHPLHNIGEQDLTAHVNFANLAAICQKPYTLTTQREFLLAHGADVRAKILGKQQDLERLIAPDQMGDLFKVLCF
jgi:SAM-dependent MidA family methyltransferase